MADMKKQYDRTYSKCIYKWSNDQAVKAQKVSKNLVKKSITYIISDHFDLWHVVTMILIDDVGGGGGVKEK